MKEEQEKLLRYIGEIFEQRRLEKRLPDTSKKFPDALNHKIISAGKRIRTIREQKGMTVEELGVLADLAPYYITEIEIGEADPYMTEIYDLSKALGVSISVLFEVA